MSGIWDNIDICVAFCLMFYFPYQYDACPKTLDACGTAFRLANGPSGISCILTKSSKPPNNDYLMVTVLFVH